MGCLQVGAKSGGVLQSLAERGRVLACGLAIQPGHLVRGRDGQLRLHAWPVQDD